MQYQVYEVTSGDKYESASSNKHKSIDAAIAEMKEIAFVMYAKRLRVLSESGCVVSYIEDCK